ncbi:hypothetical protein AKJ40_03215 [candidate division MSBL1 archaeon SCGC-AAA259M10]|uniref:Peptidase M50 domain-containing protein n=1 Tax=candidate division MSBL1 archaeon SCGC-AAA259M10 TaxID=1698270 RepID=A0A133UYX9_9EURY|nr:hypothetical protein AKJ40_03215 [candidate division MSBL1 archaeon SCGC-AAA259M10]
MLSFEKKELRDITISVCVLAVAVSGIGPNWRGLGRILVNLVSVSLPLVAGFFIHEMAHKAVAQNYGYRSFFQMWIQGLLFALIIGILSSGRFLFAAPGAVMIRAGHASIEENGKISLAGPLANLGVASLFSPLTLFSGLIASIGHFGVFINLWLALFNFLPIGPLDGRKIFDWKPKIGIVMLILIAILVFFVL